MGRLTWPKDPQKEAEERTNTKSPGSSGSRLASASASAPRTLHVTRPARKNEEQAEATRTPPPSGSRGGVEPEIRFRGGGFPVVSCRFQSLPYAGESTGRRFFFKARKPFRNSAPPTHGEARDCCNSLKNTFASPPPAPPPLWYFCFYAKEKVSQKSKQAVGKGSRVDSIEGPRSGMQ